MRRKIKPALFIALVVAGAGAAFAAEPAAQEVLHRALALPTVPFEGTISVTYWHSRATTAEEVHIVFNPPNRTRWQFLLPNGRVDREMTTDGDSDQLQIVSPARSFSGDALKSTAKKISEEQEWNLLLSNYDITLGAHDTVAGHACQLVILKPKTSGKPLEKIWVDKKTGVILEIRRVHPATGVAMVSRYVKFTSWEAGDQAAPVVTIDPATEPKEEHPLQLDFLSKEDLDKDGRFAGPVPQSLRDGFIFESADFMQVKGGTVHQLRYTDGLCVLSLFQTEHATRGPKGSKGGALDRNGMLEFFSWNQSQRHYTLMGDVSRDLLQDISRSFQKP